MTLPARNRVESIDLLKGLVMVVMALDHVRDYFHISATVLDPSDPLTTSVPVFFTRWITHFCAPSFSFLAGVSAYMVGKRKTTGELSGYLLKRGLWLVLIELTIVNFGWYFDPQWRFISVLVIWSLGISMVVLSVLVRLQPRFILLFAVVLIFGHNLLDNVPLGNSLPWSIFHQENFFNLSDHYTLFVGYPLVPWVAVMALGYYFGSFYTVSVDPARRKKLFNIIGISALAGFVVLRFLNAYGNPTPWTQYETLFKSMVSFLSPNKYPPSLMYLLMTLGGTFLFLANTEKWKGKVVDFFSTFGRVPFFYYILHLYLIHLLAMVAAELTGFGWQKFVLTMWINFDPELRGYGFRLWVVYVVWAGVILALYPLCRWFDKYKHAHREKWWLSYL